MNEYEWQIPLGWKVIKKTLDGYMAVGKIKGSYYSVICSIHEELDKNLWVHLSISPKNKKLPDYYIMKELKALFLGEEVNAIEVYAKASNHVNINPFCRHLWCRLDGKTVPDFTHGTGSI